MKIVTLSNIEAQTISHGPHILKKVLAGRGEIPGIMQLARAVFPSGERAGLHRHVDMWEVFLTEFGIGEIVVDGHRYRLEPGVCAVIEPGEAHDLVNTGSEPLVLTYFGTVDSARGDAAGVAGAWIQRLGLQKHPEGGWFRETYRSREIVAAGALPARYGGSRCFSTQIYYLLESGDFSAFHRIRSDEVWHFHAGSPIAIHVLGEAAACSRLVLGANPDRGESFQAVVLAGSWFAAEVIAIGSFALAGCTVAPGFDFADFEIALSSTLCEQYPQHETLIRRLTRDSGPK